VTLLAAVHLSPAVAIPAAIALAALGVWQLRRSVQPGTPQSRTRIRFLSMSTRLLLLIPAVLGLSVYDPAVDPLPYMLSWGAAVGLLGISVLLAWADVRNTVRLRATRHASLAGDLEALERELRRDPGAA